MRAIADLIPNLPETQLAPWQIARMPDIVGRSSIFAQGGYDGNVVCRGCESPVFTVTANSNQAQMKAVLIGGANTSAAQAGEGVGCSFADEPTRCVNASNSGQWRAVLVDDSGNSNCTTITTRTKEMPSFTVTASRGICRAVAGIRTVAISPRCLARFQSFPDSYMLPDSLSLAVRIIGNAVPPMLYLNVLGGFRQWT